MARIRIPGLVAALIILLTACGAEPGLSGVYAGRPAAGGPLTIVRLYPDGLVVHAMVGEAVQPSEIVASWDSVRTWMRRGVHLNVDEAQYQLRDQTITFRVALPPQKGMRGEAVVYGFSGTVHDNSLVLTRQADDGPPEELILERLPVTE